MFAKLYNPKRFSVFLHYAFYIMHCLAIVHLLTQLLKLSQMLAKPYNLKRFSVFLHYALCILHYALLGCCILVKKYCKRKMRGKNHDYERKNALR